MKIANYFPPGGADTVVGGTEEIDGEPFLAIRNVDSMPHFLMNVVGAGDLWMFAGSNASLTTGRVSPGRAMFPYRTVDKILGSRSGGNLFCSMLLREADDRWSLWEPWSEFRAAPVRRNLYKHITGGALVFEEIHEPSGLAFRWHLGLSDAHGLVKRTSLVNRSKSPVAVRCLEGFQHILPPGVPLEMQDRKSYLALAYMRHELAGDLAIFSLHSGITDRAEPSESLRYAAGWTLGGTCSASLLSDRQIGAFRGSGRVAREAEIRGGAGSYLQMRELTLEPGASAEWWSALDTWLDHAGLVALQKKLAEPDALLTSLKQGYLDNLRALRQHIGEMDGWQIEDDPSIRPHHAANVLFNAMRGGLPADSHRVPAGDFSKFVTQRNCETAAKNAAWLAGLPADLDLAGLRELAAAHGDPDIRRLAGEYLPLTFGRRHGDPSRPWNSFAILVRDAHGLPALNYQGNWRDVFQNWEGLSLSHPLHLPAMIAVFLNASTADGYNGYRIERTGPEWEVFDPEDPWSNIGYWGDHQIIYLSRLLELHGRYFPDNLAARLAAEDYVYTDVPYRIRPWEDLVKNPRNSIGFDQMRHDELHVRADAIGNDGKLLRDMAGNVVRANLAEKLLVPVLAKLANLVPGGGIWMNTQRPEWNDADNALAGWGLSMVTVSNLHRHLLLLRDLFSGANGVSLPSSVANFLLALGGVLDGEARTPVAVGDSRERWKFLDRSGKTAETYRKAVYGRSLGPRISLPAEEILGFLESAIAVCRSTILSARRQDGLFHSFNFLKISAGRAEFKNLNVMLEGQVAVLGSRCLPAAEALEVVRALPASPLYRPDQNSYILYPDRVLTPILERNRISAPERAPVLGEMAQAGLRSIAVRDAAGEWRFAADLANADVLSCKLDELENDATWGAAVRRDRAVLLAMWEETFHHSAFTGRSAGMFGFEGLGSIYWHMVAKLLLAVGECFSEAPEGESEVREGLAKAYRDIRAGLGFCKTPAEYGAFPSDPYSHTPAHGGAQQPGMTGQVKEEILCRFLELGVNVQSGRISFDPRLLRKEDFLAKPGTFSFLGKSGNWESLELPAGAMAFTLCQTPVLYLLGDHMPSIHVDYADANGAASCNGVTLSVADTGAIIRRSPEILRITVHLARSPAGSPPSSR